MENVELADLALNSLRYRSLRSWLAILGIVIGVASIISLISISVGMNESIQTNLSGMGANLVTISPGGQRAERMSFGGAPPPGASGFSGGQVGSSQSSSTSAQITFIEAESLRRVEGVRAVDAQVQGRGSISYRNRNSSLTVVGTDPSAFPGSIGNTIIEGRSLGTGDTSSVVLGYSVMADTFNDSMLNKQIRINGVSFRVVGVLNQSGSSFSSSDRNVYIPQKAARKLFDQDNYASSVVLVAADGYDTDEVAASAASLLRTLHRVSEGQEDFSISTATSLQSTISSVTNTLGLFLGGIASISLIVGGIGVANAMFTSVLEQTRYIGLLKSIGARNGTILKLFLFEAGMVGFVGGVLGIILSFIGSMILASFGLPSKITLDLVLLGMGFSVAVGAVAGLIPARNAASVEPVEALRYE